MYTYLWIEIAKTTRICSSQNLHMRNITIEAHKREHNQGFHWLIRAFIPGDLFLKALSLFLLLLKLYRAVYRVLTPYFSIFCTSLSISFTFRLTGREKHSSASDAKGVQPNVVRNEVLASIESGSILQRTHINENIWKKIRRHLPQRQ